MNFSTYIIRYGEIAIKGKNRPFFENTLIHNIKRMLAAYGLSFAKIEKVYGRLILFSSDDCSHCLRHIFGIVSFSPAIVSPHMHDALQIYTQGSFRVSTQRISKDYPLTSQQVNERIGGMIVEQTGAKVDLEHFDCEVGIEIIGDSFYFFNTRIRGLGGLPADIEGKVGIFCEDWKSVVAAFLLMKRGCEPVFFGKKIDLTPLTKYSPSSLSILKKNPEDVVAVVVNDTFSSIRNYPFPIPIFRPLIAFDTSALKKIYKTISL